jgi:3-oxoadipate enol-lactonase
MTILTTPDGTEIYYETHGDPEGVPVVLIHGLGADHSMWDCQIRKYPEMGIFSIVVDVRWHGISTGVGRFRIEDCARDIVDILESMGLKRASIAGVSMGGLIAQRFAINFPEMVEKLVIVDSFSSIGGYAMRFNSKLALLLTKLFSKAALIKLINSAYRGRGEENRFDVLHELGAVRAPTLVLVGDHHGRMAIKMAKETAKHIKNARFEVLKGGGDPSNMMAPELFDCRVTEFIKR